MCCLTFACRRAGAAPRTLALGTLAVGAVAAPPRLTAQPPGAARQDSARAAVRRGPRDSVAVLAPVEVRASIVPNAAPDVSANAGAGVPARVAVADGRRLAAWKPRVLPEALGAQAGVSFYDDLGTPWKLNLTARGFTVGPTVGLPPGISVFVDGVRQNEPDAQEVNFDLLPLEHAARVEVLEGSASLLGANSLGGAINLVTRRGGDDPSGAPSGTLELSGASFGGAAGEGSAGGRTAGGTDYYTGGGYERERGWREATGARRGQGFVSVGRTGRRRGATLRAFAATSRAETAGSLPESIFDATRRVNFTAGDFEDLDAEQLALSGYAPVGAGRGGLTAFVRRSGGERLNVNQAPDPNVRSRTANTSVGATGDWRWAAPAGPGTLALRFGADAAANRTRVRIYAEPQEPSNAADPGADDDDDAPAPVGLTTDVRSPGLDAAAYALADYRVGRVTLSGGGRYDYVRVPFHNGLDPDDRTTNTYRRLSPRAGMTVEVGGGASVYASAGGSFRAPALLELGCADPEAACQLPFALGDDPPLRPVRATTLEAGGRWAPRGTRAVTLTASAYRTDVRDELLFVSAPGALLSGYFRNVDRTRRAGLELGADGAVALGARPNGAAPNDATPHAVAPRDGAAGAGLAWYAGYALTRATFRSPVTLFSLRADDDFAGSPLAGPNAAAGGNRLPLVPAQQAKAGGRLRLRAGAAGGVDLGLDARYVGRQWARGDEANETAPLPAYALVNARVGYDVGRWAVAAVVTNLFDSQRAVFGTFNENRRTGALERFLTPLTARGATVALRRSFGRARPD